MERIFDSLNEVDLKVDPALRPRTFEEFVGQEKIKAQLDIAVSAARLRNEALDHVLFCGPPGLGKTTLSTILSQMLGTGLKTSSGPVIEKAGDLAGLLTSLSEGDILFIDEIHRLNRVVEEYLYSAMEDRCIDIMIDKGPNARSIKLDLVPFTLVGATTRSGLLSSPLRSRFGMMHHLNYYTPDEVQKIIMRSAGLLGSDIDMDAAMELAKRSRGTARIANHLLKRVRDFALVKGFDCITRRTVSETLSLLDVDELGLDEMDKKILTVLVSHYNGGPVGLSTLAVAVGEEPQTLEEVYEPYLILSGFIKRTPNGRMATELAYRHLGFLPGSAQNLLI